MKRTQLYYGIHILLALNSCNQNTQTMKQPELGKQSVNILKIDNLEFKDLNKNGTLDIYEDWRLSS